MNTRPIAPEGFRRTLEVAEIQGLYGPFIFTERLLQKIWLRGEFDTARAVTTCGRPLQVLQPGRWNPLGGPDFLNARLRLSGADLAGDVELHLHASDWAAHAHSGDRAYDRVVLHVVLFPPSPDAQACRVDGAAIPTLVLLPLLLHDLEEYAAEDAVEALTNRADWRAIEELARRPVEDVHAILVSHAEQRWRQKVSFALRRITRLGWAEAGHHAALEILGYRFNRTPMLKIAARAPLRDWSGDSIDREVLFTTEASAWSLQGVRPANHPRVRLRQYAQWVAVCPNWPEALERLGRQLPETPFEGSTPVVRKLVRFSDWRARFARDLTGGVMVGTRLDNLICDGFVPLLAAETGRNLHPLWHHWYAGDLPRRLATSLKALGLCSPRTQPLCHGLGQGLLGWMLARETRAH